MKEKWIKEKTYWSEARKEHIKTGEVLVKLVRTAQQKEALTKEGWAPEVVATEVKRGPGRPPKEE